MVPLGAYPALHSTTTVIKSGEADLERQRACVPNVVPRLGYDPRHRHLFAFRQISHPLYIHECPLSGIESLQKSASVLINCKLVDICFFSVAELRNHTSCSIQLNIQQINHIFQYDLSLNGVICEIASIEYLRINLYIMYTN